MKQHVLILGAFLAGLTGPAAQQTKGVAPITPAAAATGQTWAVVVGVSDYQDPGITDLQFAHRDASAFAAYLQSPAGGGLDDEHITLLLNRDATLGQFSRALDWLLEVVREGDQAIIYFSGHGDVERKMITQPGYLLCWDAPSRVYYSGGALGLPIFQEIITTLSVQSKARVLVITDACRAGKLAGSEIGGVQLTAANLAKQYANEVKILSCRAGELSQEGMAWGGGRGVFSYYFLNGMAGMADQNRDGIVNLREIERYLEDWVPEATGQSQNPVLVTENKTAPIARVDAAALAALMHNNGLNDLSDNLLASNDKGLLSALEADPSALAQYNEFKTALKERRLLRPEETSAWHRYEQLRDKPVMAPFQNQMRRNLAAALQDEAQQAMNAYLKADPAELRKRWNQSESYYDYFPEYLEKAAELLGAEHRQYKSLIARARYFKALNYRLRGERAKTPALYNLALTELQECLNLEPDAAYAYNELGLLHRRLKKYKEAIADFEQAFSKSPGWVLPWANLTTTYNNLKDYANAEIAGRQAVRLDSSFALAHYNLGLTYHLTGNLSGAKKHYKQAIHHDPDYEMAFFNLGLIYFGENDFARAQQMWEIYYQQAPDDPDGLVNLGEAALKLGQAEKALSLFNQALELDPKCHAARLSIGQMQMNAGKYDEAESAFWRYAEQKSDDPIPYYYLACIKILQNQPEQAEQHLNKAVALDKEFKLLRQDNNRLKPLREHARFMELLDRLSPGWKQ